MTGKINDKNQNDNEKRRQQIVKIEKNHEMI